MDNQERGWLDSISSK